MSIDPRPSAAEAGKAGGSLAEKLEELAADHNFPIDWESRWKRSTAELVRAAARLALEEVAKKFCECRPIDLLGRTSHSHDCDSAFDDVQRIAIDLGGGGQPAPLAKPLKGVDHE